MAGEENGVVEDDFIGDISPFFPPEDYLSSSSPKKSPEGAEEAAEAIVADYTEAFTPNTIFDPEGAEEAIGIDYTEAFTTNTTFVSRQAVIDWVRDVGNENGFVIILRASENGRRGKKPRLYFTCERSGSYRGSSKKPTGKGRTSHGTKKCGCPFSLKGIKLSTSDDWQVVVVCGMHNHPVSKPLKGRSFAGRLRDHEIELLIEMSMAQAKPKEILNTLKTRDEHNASTVRTIYNALHKFRVAEKIGRSWIPQLMKNLTESNYILMHSSNETTSCVRNLFFAHPTSVELLRAFPEVLMMDCTYKTNRYRLPLLEIVGVTSTELTFSVAFVYMEVEQEDTYTWALEQLRDLLQGCTMPHVIVTDTEVALMNAITHVFPQTHNHVCRWHILRNLSANCKKFFETKQLWDAFVSSWNTLVMSPTEEEYLHQLNALNQNFVECPEALDYVNVSLLDRYKEKFVAAWVDKNMHVGNVTMNRAEGVHAKLKTYLGTFTVSFESLLTNIHTLLERQHTEIRASLDRSRNNVQHRSKPTLFKELIGCISRNALNIVRVELTRAESIGPYAQSCGCASRRIHGLPCAHEIAEFKHEGCPIPLSCINPHWTKLNLEPTMDDANMVPVITAGPDRVQLMIIAELDSIQKQFDKADDDGKLLLIRKLKDISSPETTSVIESDMNVNVKGALKRKRNGLVESSTSSCDPSLIEHVLPIEENKSSPALPIMSPRSRQKEKVIRNQASTVGLYTSQFPIGLSPYILHVGDVTADGNCGFRAIAALLGMSEENWGNVRIDLSRELNSHRDEYMAMYGERRFEELNIALAYLEPNPPLHCWMTMPCMGHIIASCYSCVLIHISARQCLTFLPLRAVPQPLPSRRHIAIGFVDGNHFVQVYLMNGHPLPPIAEDWYEHRHQCAHGWEASYDSRIQHFKEIVGTDVATVETMTDLTD